MDKKDRLSSNKSLRHGPGKMHNGKPCTHYGMQDASLETITRKLIAKAKESGRAGKRDDEI